jgi:hypothetical protein
MSNVNPWFFAGAFAAAGLIFTINRSPQATEVESFQTKRFLPPRRLTFSNRKIQNIMPRPKNESKWGLPQWEVQYEDGSVIIINSSTFPRHLLN